MFYSSLQSAIANIKPKQFKCLEAVYSGEDTIGTLPKGMLEVYNRRYVTWTFFG